MKKLTIFIIFPVLLSSCISDEPEKENTYRENFEILWKIIDTQYCFLDSKRINWDSVYDVYNARLGNDTTDEIRFFDAMSEMLAVLKDGHVNLYSSFDRSRYWKWFTDYPANFSSALIFNENYLGNNYRSINGLRYNILPEGKVGYIYYPSFSDVFTDQNIGYVMQIFKNCEGIILDVRNNGGGSADMSAQLASYFFPRDTVNLYMKHKTGPGHSDFSALVPITTPANTSIQWEKPVIVLSNRSAYSATNMFISRIRDAPKAIVTGDKSGGGGGLPVSNELPNGWMVRFSSSPLYDIQKQDIENGVEPDIRTSLDSTAMAGGRDSMIDYGIYLITGKHP